MPAKTMCPECGEGSASDMTVYVGKNLNGVPIIFLGCDICSATLWTVDANNFAAHLGAVEANTIANLVGFHRPKQTEAL
jgi:hypothetical protein